MAVLFALALASGAIEMVPPTTTCSEAIEKIPPFRWQKACDEAPGCCFDVSSLAVASVSMLAREARFHDVPHQSVWAGVELLRNR